MANKQVSVKNKQSTTMIVNGAILAILSPFIAPLLSVIQESHCQKNSFGQCTLSSSLMAGIIDTFLPWAIFAAGLILVTLGALRTRKK